MRLVVEMVPVGDHQIEGEVRGEGHDGPVAFCGWLEFLRILEDLTRGQGGPLR